ncbi:uncharacterized protein CCOS01_10896 [Colletotrichum costaricense]|uniref:Uncharacterized protein n=1 Tax=Colletotrichum costaricense TaxID=1209916 RepID=A0AAI9YS32_9PEZI|nr:uncharacterized protein CCOS01_10896 [Colletotrichum costaricense]KAK1520777.1 hypothetical protein CCOS01_10896 [Colletotrichum costaricense]
MFFSCRAKQPTPPPPRPHCVYSGCVHKVLKCEAPAKAKRILSIFCKDHACRSRTGEKMCTNPKQPGLSKYCEDQDGRCHCQGCTNQRIFADANQDWPYCQSHTCASYGCHNKRATNSQMCSFHTPICLIPACGHPRVGDGLYCPSHSCTDKDCNSVIDGGNWCRDHRLCKTAGCDSLRVVSPGGTHEEVCWFHLPTACNATACGAVVSGGVHFCPQHECTYPPCRERKDNATDASRLYCASHTCHAQTCPQPAADLANPSKPPHQPSFCVAHKCAASPECPHPSKPSSRRCALHACLHPSCPTPRADDPLLVSASQFCMSHECRAAGCHGAARSNGSFCDAVHACVVPGCPSPRGVGTGVQLGAGGPGSVCCALHTAMIARDTAGWSTATERKSMPTPPSSPLPLRQKQKFPYLSQTEEALGMRFREERERHDQEARLAEETRAWHAVTTASAARGGNSDIEVVGGVPLPGGVETRGKRHKARRRGSYDSGVAPSPTVSEGTSPSDFTFVS